jgi:hypothetical protein
MCLGKTHKFPCWCLPLLIRELRPAFGPVLEQIAQMTARIKQYSLVILRKEPTN